LGHASIRTTADIYGSLPESVDRAVADKLDDLFAAARGAAVVQPENEKRASGADTRRDLAIQVVEVSGFEPPTSTLRTGPRGSSERDRATFSLVRGLDTCSQRACFLPISSS